MYHGLGCDCTRCTDPEEAEEHDCMIDEWGHFPLIMRFMKKNPSGGVFHVVLGDGNLESVGDCLEEAREAKDRMAIKVGEALEELPFEAMQRLYERIYENDF